MKTILPLAFTILCSTVFFTGVAPAQLNAGAALPLDTNITIAYNLYIDGGRKTDIEEVYNGGNKTIFISNGQARMRLVSLMRIESIFFNFSNNAGGFDVTIVKESGKDKYKSRLTGTDWENYNKKYEGLKCKFTGDTLTILSYACKKAVIKLIDGREITAYYTDSFYNPLLVNIDPAFKYIPGTVLKYQYKHKGRSITYTAASITVNKVNSAIFKIPEKGFAVKEFALQ